MKAYFDAKSKVWICESEFLGRKYIGEGHTEKEAVSLCLEWENALANEVQHELR